MMPLSEKSSSRFVRDPGFIPWVGRDLGIMKKWIIHYNFHEQDCNAENVFLNQKFVTKKNPVSSQTQEIMENLIQGFGVAVWLCPAAYLWVLLSKVLLHYHLWSTDKFNFC